MRAKKFIVKHTKIDGEPYVGASVYMRTGPGNRNLVRIAICPCGHAKALAKTLNTLWEAIADSRGGHTTQLVLAMSGLASR